MAQLEVLTAKAGGVPRPQHSTAALVTHTPTASAATPTARQAGCFSYTQLPDPIVGGVGANTNAASTAATATATTAAAVSSRHATLTNQCKAHQPSRVTMKPGRVQPPPAQTESQTHATLASVQSSRATDDHPSRYLPDPDGRNIEDFYDVGDLFLFYL